AGRPENFALMSRDAERMRAEHAEKPGDGPWQEFAAEQAQRLGMWIVAGTIPMRAEDPRRPASACCLFDGSGTLAARYDKMHLFDVSLPGRKESYRESATTTAGSEPVVAETPFGRLGLAVCYDLRFPELFRAMGEQGAEMVALPAAFTRPTGEAHWYLLVRARAVENLCYMLASAQHGSHPGGRESYGHSMLVEPWGQVVGECREGDGVLCHDVALDKLDRLRSGFPALDHRRLSSDLT
ncbi:MAG: carbon-nitrogen hydrolase family protein, partial [Gammaproteobacteria bacterium]|nr:carbon-nitrogen hydrolase family protein [Gammaproteobacteria bacterium]